MVIRQKALAAKTNLQSDMAAPGIEPGSRGYEPGTLTSFSQDDSEHFLCYVDK